MVLKIRLDRLVRPSAYHGSYSVRLIKPTNKRFLSLQQQTNINHLNLYININIYIYIYFIIIINNKYEIDVIIEKNFKKQNI